MQMKGKKNMMRAVIALILSAGVLALLPVNIFASWVKTVRTPSAEQSVQGTLGDITVNYKFFSENLYVDAVGTTKYYVFDASAADNYYIGSADSGVDSIEALELTGIAFTQTKTLASQTAPTYCTGSHSLSTCKYQSSPSQTNFQVSLNVNLPYTATDVGSPVYQDGPYRITMKYNEQPSSVSLSTKTLEHVGVLYSGVDPENSQNTRTIRVYTVYTISAATMSVSVTSEQVSCSGIGNKAYTCTGTPTVTLTGTYQIYVREDVGTPAKTEAIGAVSNGDALYTVAGYRTGDVVTAPSHSVLLKALPASVQESTKSVVGYYSEATADANKIYQMPITIGKDATVQTDANGQKYIDIWVKLTTTNPMISDGEKTDYNSAIAAGTSLMLGNLSTLTNASDITNDIAYNADNRTFGLWAENVSGTLELGFAYNETTAKTNVNGLKSDTPTEDDNLYTGDPTVALDSYNTRDYTVVLQEDISLSGTLYVGGYTGVYSNTTEKAHSFIVKSYVALDLNGHTLAIKNGGVLHSFGYIYDSVGTGRIVVETGGTLYTQFLIYGMGGLSRTLKLFDMGYCPFEDYNLAYLNATVDIMVDGNSSGNLIGFSMLYPSASLGAFFNYYIPLFSSAAVDGSDPLFTLQQRTDSTTAQSYVRMTMKRLDSLSTLSASGYDTKNVFTFVGVHIRFAAPTMTLKIAISIINTSVYLDMKKVVFPISPLVDLTCVDSVFELGQSAIVMPGATLTFDENSILRLTSNGEKTFDKISILINTGVAKVTKTLVGQLYAPSYNVQGDQVYGAYRLGMGFGNTSAAFWNYFGTASVNIYGTVEFVKGVGESYILSGNVNVASFRAVDSNGSGGERKAWTAYNLTAANLEGVKLQTYGSFAVAGQSKSVSSSNEHTAKVMHYYTLPLMSDGTAYLVDTNAATFRTGTYDRSDGVFTETGTGDTYVILTTTTLPKNGEAGEVTFTYAIAKADVEQKVATCNGATYVYYCGLYVPCTVTTNDAGEVTACTITLTNTFDDAGAEKQLSWSATDSRWK